MNDLKKLSFNVDKFEEYCKNLKAIGSLSRLFSSSNTPFIHYRSVEILYTQLCNGENIAGEDCSYDVITESKIPVGVKTFVVSSDKSSAKTEKIAEFNQSYKEKLKALTFEEANIEVAKWRNARVESDAREKGVEASKGIYHCLVRYPFGSYVHEEPYTLIDVSKLKPIDKNGNDATIFSGYYFKDDRNKYNFNNSKSTLFKRFDLNSGLNSNKISIAILDNPLEKLQLLNSGSLVSKLSTQLKFDLILSETESLNPGVDYIVLPLYSISKSKRASKIAGKDVKVVADKSGINQWLADGRVRSDKEIYIPVPVEILDKCKGFLPPKETPFQLKLPNGKTVNAKLCQGDRGKAIMSNPNSDLGNYIFSVIDAANNHSVTNRAFTYDDLIFVEKDSVRIVKTTNGFELTEFCKLNSYDDFIQLLTPD